MSSLFEVLKAHQHEAGHRDMREHCTCGLAGPLREAEWIIRHQAAALEAAGYGKQEEHVREVLAAHEGYGEEAWCPACKEHWPCQTVAAETEWGTRTKWGPRPNISKQNALDYMELCKSCGDHATLIKRRAAIDPGPWEDA